MKTYSAGGKTILLPAVKLAQMSVTERPHSWIAGFYISVEVTDAMYALRVHTNGKIYPGRDPSYEAGKWILLGDVIMTSGGVARSRVLPGAFTHVSRVVVKKQTILNIGLAAPVPGFDGAGGGWQAEHAGGPYFDMQAINEKVWMSFYGNA